MKPYNSVRLVCQKCLRMPVVEFPKGLKSYQIQDMAASRTCKCGKVGMYTIPSYNEATYAKLDKQGFVGREIIRSGPKPWKAEEGWIKPFITYDCINAQYVCRFPRTGPAMVVVGITPEVAYAAWLEKWIAGYGHNYKEQV